MHAPQPRAAHTPPPPAQEQNRLLLDEADQRSHIYGVSPNEAPTYTGLAAQRELKGALEENRFLFQHAVPVMETLYSQIANTHSMVLLTSARGMVLHALGDNDFLEKASRVALVPGADWSEQTKGTNAIGTALSAQEAVTVHGSQHYMHANKALTCSCAPILDPHGQLVGALDVTGDHRSYQQHTLALVRMSAQMIENQMFAGSFPKAVRLHFHSRPEFLGTLVEGIAAFSAEGRFLSANRSAQFQLGMSFNALQAHTFSSLFNLPISALFDLFCGPIAHPQQLCLHNGVKVWCRSEMKPSGPWAAPSVAPLSPTPGHETCTQTSHCTTPPPSTPPRKPQQLSSLQYLDTGDAQLSGVIAKLRKVINRDIPVMILGETGSGKDLLAQAMHHDSARARQPFVPVNCASIPDSLIESELFGYEEGAFTGARKKGSPGKILQAHGGTLFLDEIGDMPKHLQARLLRVLQERKVSPLGAGKEVEVDVNVISATHKNLKELIARGEFREDLYYRLNGLVVRIPTLRERTDFDAIVKKILLSLSDPTTPITIAPEVMELLQSYHWPGNVRQLHNLLRTAVVMVETNGIIGLEHLPDDFLDEIHGAPTPTPLSRTVLIPTAMPIVPMAETLPPVCPDQDKQERQDSSADDPHRLQDVTINAMAQMLRLHKGNVSAAAKALGVSRNTIYRKKNLLPSDLLD